MSEIQSLARGLRILTMIAEAEQGLTITELADALDIDKSSASRLVKTLVSYDFIRGRSNSRQYVLGMRLYQMSWQLLNRTLLREKAKPYLYQLVNTTGECAHIGVHSEGKALVIDDVEAEASLRVVGGVGRLIPLHCTALGKSLLAFADLPAPAADQLVARTTNTIITVPELAREVNLTQQRGFAYDNEENDVGCRCIAAPVYNYTGIAIAAIGISGPTVRVTDDRLAYVAEEVRRVARQLSDDLGYSGQWPS